ncbi:LamG-like jellyroll fold domain-containing protein [Flagellimonas sp. S3867]|uniref:LamG-like jellyroll fold domain-containing protein n=1 Tax=Flagellimonas sp. S3867 TaxID=2768063 RepID=UPI001688E530|nr:LamG-like jellyroll fold domain-containing protein [Flagellimonas sp. S3867]
MKSNTIYRKTKTLGLMVIIAAIFGSCARNDDGYLRESNVDSALLPEADFTASQTTVDQDGTITFTDASTNTPILYTWNFDGGNPPTSTEASPTVEYPISGEFNVSLKVRNDFGADEVLKEGFIIVESTAEPLDPAITVRMNYEESLLNEGSAGGAGASTGAPAYETGIIGENAYSFDGSNAVTLNGYTGVNGSNSRTVSAWVKTTTTERITISHWGESGTGSRATFAINPDGTIRSEFQGGGLNSVATVNDGEWHHVAHTYDGAVLTVYVDGIASASLPTTTIDTGNAGETDVEIGAQFGARIFNGAMDDFRIYDIALDAGSIGLLAAQPTVEALLNFEGSLLNEGSAGGAGVSTGAPAYETGIIGENAYAFDGANAVTLSGYTGVNGPNSRTVSAWVKTTTTERITISHWGESGTGSRATFAVNPDGTIRSEFQGGGLNSTAAVNDGEWHHVAYTYDGAVLTVYVDGIASASLPTTIIDTGNAGETDVEIGAQSGARIFNGAMDDFKIYSTALSPEAIMFLSQS